VNAFFVRDDLTDGKFAEPFTAENHYHPPRYYLKFATGWPARASRVQAGGLSEERWCHP
jgi:hypothetical protein